MTFNEIYALVEEKRTLSIEQMLKECNADIVRDNDLMRGFEARSMIIDDVFVIFLQEGLPDIRENYLILHELGHFYCDTSKERDANLFVCLYLINNQIWEDCYFQEYLVCNGADRKVADQVNDAIYSYKMDIQSQIGWRICHQKSALFNI